MTYDFDLVVVGGGPAGTSAAAEAAKHQVSVAVVERESTIAETVRTSGVTWMKNIDEFGIPRDCFNPVRNYGFCSPNNAVLMRDSVPRAAVLDVRRTYRWLAQRAKEHGADIFTGINVKGAVKNKEGSIAGVTGMRDGEQVVFRSKMVIDASGFQSAVCKAMDLAPGWKRFGAGAEFEAKAENVDADTWWLMVGQKYSPAGYAWIFPVGEDTVRIGVGVGKPESAVDPTALLKELMDARAGPIKNLGSITPLEFHYGLIPNEGLSRRTVYDNLVLVGDSAGQANPLVLEGIRYAIRFGGLAGTVSARAIKNGATGAEALHPYERTWRREIQRNVASAGKVQDRWLGLTDDQWDRELDIIRELSPEEFLDFIRADFGLARSAKLVMRHPKLAVRQLFGLVRP